MSIAALDIGGANLKAAHSSGEVRFVPFEVWRRPDELPDGIEAILRSLPPCDILGITMTAELCDSYSTRREGVERILEAVRKAGAAAAPGAIIKVLRVDGKLADLEAASAEPLAAASANWMALALFAARLLPRGRCVVADTGSTTTDLIPVKGGLPIPGGRTDPERLLLGELVYTGVRRTPVVAVTDRLPFHDRSCPVAAELFATMLDAYLLTGDLPEERGPSGFSATAATLDGNGGRASGTADGREATRARARDRLAHMLCADRDAFDDGDALAAARFLASAQEKKVRQGLLLVAERLGGPIEAAVVSGEGEFLLHRAIHRLWPRCEIISLSKRLGPEVSRAACAHALVRIVEERARCAASPGVSR